MGGAGVPLDRLVALGPRPDRAAGLEQQPREVAAHRAAVEHMDLLRHCHGNPRRLPRTPLSRPTLAGRPRLVNGSAASPPSTCRAGRRGRGRGLGCALGPSDPGSAGRSVVGTSDGGGILPGRASRRRAGGARPDRRAAGAGTGRCDARRWSSRRTASPPTPCPGSRSPTRCPGGPARRPVRFLAPDLRGRAGSRRRPGALGPRRARRRPARGRRRGRGRARGPARPLDGGVRRRAGCGAASGPGPRRGPGRWWPGVPHAGRARTSTPCCTR